MIQIFYSKKGTPYVKASDLHKELEIPTRLSTWFPRMIDYGFIENVDYSLHKIVQSSNSLETTKFDWSVRLEMAQHIAMIQRTERGKKIREYLLHLDKQVQEGALLNHKQVSVLFDLCRVLGFFSIQTKLEKDHYDYLNAPKDWWAYRARLFGYSTNDLKAMVEAIGKKYKSQRQALIAINKYEPIRVATIDLMIAMGKTEAHAKNVATFVMEIAKQIKPEVYDDRKLSIDFKSEEQKETIRKIENRENEGAFLDTL